MVYNPCMHTYSLGNSLGTVLKETNSQLPPCNPPYKGNYFHEASCALEANMSIVFPLKVWDNPYMPLEYRHGKVSLRSGHAQASASQPASPYLSPADALPASLPACSTRADTARRTTTT